MNIVDRLVFYLTHLVVVLALGFVAWGKMSLVFEWTSGMPNGSLYLLFVVCTTSDMPFASMYLSIAHWQTLCVEPRYSSSFSR